MSLPFSDTWTRLRDWSPNFALAALLLAASFFVAARAGGPGPGLALDVAICLVAAASGPLPRVGTVATLGLHGLSLLMPAYPGVNEYAALLPILATAVARLPRWRWGAAAGVYALNLSLSSRRLHAEESLLDYAFIWLIWVAAAWLLGGAVRRLLDVSTLKSQQRLAGLRREIARELHDTVANDLSLIVMRAEQSRLAGGATDADMRFIATTAERSIRGLRGLLGLLRSEDDGPASNILVHLRLGPTLDAAVADLVAHGFKPSVSIEGDLARVPPIAEDTMSKVVREASSNVIRHAAPGSDCGILVSVDEAEVEVVVSSIPGAKRFRILGRHQPMGRTGLRERVEARDGSFSAGLGRARWILRAALPLR